jgi:hypothetical protein
VEVCGVSPLNHKGFAGPVFLVFKDFRENEVIYGLGLYNPAHRCYSIPSRDISHRDNPTMTVRVLSNQERGE